MVAAMIIDYTYQYQLELCSLVFLCCLTIQFFSSKRFQTKMSFLFQWILICAVADLSFDVLGCLTLERIDQVPVWINYLVNGLYYILQSLLPMLAATYVLLIADFFRNDSTRLNMLLLPGILMILLQLMNPFTGLMFSIRMIDGSYRFIKGPLTNVLYLVLAFYLTSMALFAFHYRSRLSRKQTMTILFFCIIEGTAMLLQLILPHILFSGTGIALAIMLWDLTLQNPEHMVDVATGAFNSEALLLHLEKRKNVGHIHVTVVEIDGLRSTTGRGRELGTGKNLHNIIGEFLGSVGRKKAGFFKETKNRFWVFSKNQAELEKASSMIVERFNESWDVEGLSVELFAKVLYFSTNTALQLSGEELMAIVGQAMDDVNMVTNQKNRYIIDFAVLSGFRRRRMIEESLKRRIRSGEGFHICFQPIVSMEPDTPSTAEVLLRFSDPNLGAVSPSEFIPIVEDIGLAMLMDNYVVETACRFLSDNPEVASLHVNLSAAEFDNNPAKRISSIVFRYNIEPARLCFEITESVAARNPAVLISFMKQMIALGFSFALDDYGTGYSNAIQVLRMPFKIIKIDRILLNEGRKSREFLSSTIRMFRELGLELVVEGVENREQLNRVVDYGANYIQGFLFSKPLNDVDYLSYIKGETNQGR